MKPATTGRPSSRRGEFSFGLWLQALLITLVAGCRDRAPAPPEGTDWTRGTQVLDRATFLRGATLPTSQSLQRGLGGWSYESSAGSRGHWVRDEERRVFVAMVMSSKERLDEPRRVFFEGVDTLSPTLYRVRMNAPTGTYLKLRSLIEVNGALQRGSWIEGAIGDEPVTLTLPIEPHGLFTRGGVEFLSDCAGPSFYRIDMVEERPAGTVVHRVSAGPLTDLRQAVGVAAGSAMILDLVAAEGDVFSIAAVSASEDVASTVRLSLLVEEHVVAQAESRTTSEWSTLDLVVPSYLPAGTIRVEVDGGGVWIAEDRIDPAPPENPPTVFLITSDTHRGDHFGAFDGSSRLSTPALDRIAETGWVMTNCFTSTNITNPSHMALMTGIPARDLGILNNTTALAESAETLAELFREAGYRTFGATSVMHMRPGLSALNQGFDRYCAPAHGKRDGSVALHQLMEWMPDAEGEPLFVWLHLYDAHMPYNPPPRWLTQYYPEERDPRAPEVSLGLEEAALHPFVSEQGIRDRDYMDALYESCISYVDELVGLAIAHERLGSGIIAFTGDHGESLGEDGVFWSHTRLNQSTLHVPLLLTFPGCDTARTNAPIEQVDLGRTLLALSGISSDFPGRDLRQTMVASKSPTPRFAISATGMSASIEQGGWMLLLQISPYPGGVSQRTWEHGETELFHLPTDPQAANNVLEEHFERAKVMRSALQRWLQRPLRGKLGVRVEQSAEARESLEALGYTTAGEDEDAVAPSSLWWPDSNAPWNVRFKEN